MPDAADVELGGRDEDVCDSSGRGGRHEGEGGEPGVSERWWEVSSLCASFARAMVVVQERYASPSSYNALKRSIRAVVSPVKVCVTYNTWAFE